MGEGLVKPVSAKGQRWIAIERANEKRQTAPKSSTRMNCIAAKSARAIRNTTLLPTSVDQDSIVANTTPRVVLTELLFEKDDASPCMHLI